MNDVDISMLQSACAALAPIPDAEWRVLAARIARRSEPRGEWLVRQGDRVDWLGFLARGLVRLVHHTGEREVTLAGR